MICYCQKALKDLQDHPHIIENAFETTGLMPWNKERVLDLVNGVTNTLEKRDKEFLLLFKEVHAQVMKEVVDERVTDNSMKVKGKVTFPVNEVVEMEVFQQKLVETAETVRMANEEKAVRAKIKQEKAALKATNKELRKGFEICSIPDCISIYGEVEGEWIGCSKCGVFWVCPKHENECPGLTVLMIVRHHELHCHRDPISAAKRLKLGEGDQYVTKPVDNEDDELKHKANEKKKKTTRKRK
mgnify:CR=1 FL=1